MLSFIKSDLSMLNPFFVTGSPAREGKTEADGFGNRRVPFLPPLPTSVLPPIHSWKKRFFLPELEFSKVFVKFLWQNFRFSLIPKFHFLPFFLSSHHSCQPISDLSIFFFRILPGFWAERKAGSIFPTIPQAYCFLPRTAPPL